MSSKSYLEDVDGSWLNTWEDGVILDIMVHLDMWFSTSVPNFSYLLSLEVCQELPVLEVILRGRSSFLTGYLEDEVILDIVDLHDIWFLTCVPNFSSLAWLEVPQEPPRPRSHTWRTLKVPDWRLEGWGHPWRHGSSWYVITHICAKFKLSSITRSVKNPRPGMEVLLGGHWWFLTGYFVNRSPRTYSPTNSPLSV